MRCCVISGKTPYIIMQDANTRDNIRPIFSSDIGKETREKR